MPSEIANQPLCQCTVKIATSMVAIIGSAIQRSPRPSSRLIAPPSSAPMARPAIRVGNGRPRPQSALPNHSTVSAKPMALFQPAIHITGAR